MVASFAVVAYRKASGAAPADDAAVDVAALGCFAAAERAGSGPGQPERVAAGEVVMQKSGASSLDTYSLSKVAELHSEGREA